MREGLGEGYDAYIGFVNALESFGGGHNDPICVGFGGSVMTKFTISLREIGTYEEVLHSQVEHMLNDRLLQFVNVDVQEVKEARKRFDKASITYDQAREKYISLRKSTWLNVAATIEERKNHIRASPVSSGNHFVFKYDEFPRYSLIITVHNACLLLPGQVSALSNAEAKKRFECLEAVSGIMDAHHRIFK